MLSMIKLECSVNTMQSWLEFSLEWWLKSLRVFKYLCTEMTFWAAFCWYNQVSILLCSIFVLLFSALSSKPYSLCHFATVKTAYVTIESTWSSFGFSKYNLCWQRKDERCVLLQNWLTCTFLWNGAHIPLDWKCVRADHPSIYLTLKVLKGVCLSFKKFHVYSQCSISRHKASEEFCARPSIFSHLYCYKMISRAICIQSARVYLAKIITEKNVEVRRLSRAYPKVP